MFQTHKVELNWSGRKLILETGKIARQADGAVLVTFGDTVVLATAVCVKEAKADADFFPLTVHYQEKTYAAGRIPGGYLKRENRPSEKEVLTSRLIDRPIRPLFPEGFYNETQVICTVMSYDSEYDSAIAAMIGASAALAISGAPFLGPIGAARVGYKDGAYILNPSEADIKDSQLDLVVAGTKEGVLMVESEAEQLSEDIMLKAVIFGHEGYQDVIKAINDLAAKVNKPRMNMVDLPESYKKAEQYVRTELLAAITKAYENKVKQERYGALDVIQAQALAALSEQDIPENMVVMALEKVKSDVVRQKVLQEKTRIDGRNLVTVRPIVSEVGFLPRAHGSALFTRGETQAVVVATLGTGQDEQMVDTLSGLDKESFMLHYNFPPYSVGEAGRMGAPGRREVGHGKLAWRAIRPMLPRSDFPYTLRVVSEITESNGSSSMATVCGTSLALMDAGVQIQAPVAGIAMGLIKEGNDFAVLSDILGDEDHLGDMDFKVAGTSQGVTALQMDIKITSITPEIMKIALEQALQGRLHILGEMTKCLNAPRNDLSPRAPRILTIQVPKDKIGEVIGPGGSVIRKICEETGATIDIEDDGTTRIGAVDLEAAQKAYNTVRGIIAEPEVGVVYDGKVVNIMEFGAFVNFLGPRDGLVHISEICEERVEKVSDKLQLNDKVRVKVLGFDKGKVKLSMKGVPQS